MQASGTVTAGHVAQPFEDIRIHRVERLGPAGLGHAAPLGNRIDGDDAPGAEQERAADRELPDRAAAPDRDGVPGLMLQFSAAM